MNALEARRRLLMMAKPRVPTIGGLPVWMDNCRYISTNGLATDVDANSDYFLCGVVDTGSTSRKAYTVTRMGTSVACAMRMFNDMSAESVDYWTIMRTDIPQGNVTTYSFLSYGRFIIMTVAKAYAADFYLKDGNGNYLLKGSNVI